MRHCDLKLGDTPSAHAVGQYESVKKLMPIWLYLLLTAADKNGKFLTIVLY